MTNKPKEIVDIDAGDANNELAAKQTCANVPTAAVDGLQQWLKRMAPKPAVQKKVTAKPKPVEVIEISDEKDRLHRVPLLKNNCKKSVIEIYAAVTKENYQSL
ncbi:unnamed protein product [Trifolium pratense]|uniref:Uncharacterized protein n=1 Tax=Trifolium pratense TaxID=57577 RepID=A0ACB0JF40_TRIPR|nr:unnamed protein product [Trifolium pratense]